MPIGPAGAVVDALDEAALLLSPPGEVLHANAAALRLIGGDRNTLHGLTFTALCAGDPESGARLLRRCAGTSQVVRGAIQLRGRDGTAFSCQLKGCRVGLAPGDVQILLRLQIADRDRFIALNEKVAALNRELARNARTQAELREALHEKDLLFRELNHRVKNNLQMLIGIIRLAERRAVGQDAPSAIRDVRLRVESLGVVQRLLYGRSSVGPVDAVTLLRELCAKIEAAFGVPGVKLEVGGDPVTLEFGAASALGLAVGELVTNAYKHAFPTDAPGRIDVLVQHRSDAPGSIEIVVKDNGVGLGTDEPRGSGLVLARGLCEQLGGALTIKSASGVRASILLDTKPPHGGNGQREGAT